MNALDDAVTLDAIRDHYDQLSPLYRRFWGEHIHHGWWRDGESTAVAQERLIAELAARAQIPSGARVLDVGCGLGGSAFWFARECGCFVLGITLSSVQAQIATQRARRLGLTSRVRFEVRDAHRLAFLEESFDVVWVVECSEHLFNRAVFFQRCWEVLRPGGVLAVAAWLAETEAARHPALMDDICRAMVCPALGARADYISWMRDAGFLRIVAENVDDRVARTWSLAADIVRQPEVKAILRLSNRRTQAFAAAVPLMRDAFAVHAMGYGFFTAQKPAATSAFSA